MKNPKNLIKLGIILFFIGMLMFFITVSLFTHVGNISSIISGIGEACFILWIPTLLIGIILLIIGTLSYAIRNYLDKKKQDSM